MNEEKSIGPVEWKAAATGEFTAVFSTFGVIDHDGDITERGAFDNGTDVIVGSWGHKTSEPPIGRGVIRVSNTDARVEGRLFLDTVQGDSAFRTLKGLGNLAEWSYTFRILESQPTDHGGRRVRVLKRLKVFSVDPVLAGAGIGTRTVALKCSGCGGDPDGGGVAEALKDSRRILDEIALRDAVAEAKERIARLTVATPDERELDDWLVHPAVRGTAKAASERAASQLGITAPRIRFFEPTAYAKERVWGRAARGSSEIWLYADLSPEVVAWVASHEVKHLTQPPDMASAAAEDDANRFAVAVTGRPVPRG